MATHRDDKVTILPPDNRPVLVKEAGDAPLMKFIEALARHQARLDLQKERDAAAKGATKP